MTTLSQDHKAIQNMTTVYQKNLHDPKTYKFNILKPSTNKKLGKKITKGRWKGMKFYTLALVERETCDPNCEHLEDCYGNNMPFAHRFIANKYLTIRMAKELNVLDKRHPNGYVVRLHILGDFYSVPYVKWWNVQLVNRPALRVYGYSRWHPGSTIGDALETVRNKHSDSFKIRFSNRPDDPMSANSETLTDKGITCPVQLDKTPSCGTCGLCWATPKPIRFLSH